MSNASEAVRLRVRLLRERQGLTAQALAERCQRLGLHRITRDVIASMETRRQDFTVDEVLGLALALGVSPVHLLVPRDPWPYHVGRYRFADAGEDGTTAFDWITGQLPIDVGPLGEDLDDSVWSEMHPDYSIAEQHLMERIERMHETNRRAEALIAETRKAPRRAAARTTKKGARSGKRQQTP
jgi:hypothetical protein